MLFQDQVQQGTTMPIECTSQTDPGRNAVFADGVFSRESNHQRSCLIYDLLGVCCGKSVCFAAAEPRLESVQIDFVGAANVPESNMDACIAKDEKASEPSPAARNNPNMLFSRSRAVVDTGKPGASYCGGLLVNGAWAGAASCGEL